MVFSMRRRLYFCSIETALEDLDGLSTALVKSRVESGRGRLSVWPLDDHICWHIDGQQIRALGDDGGPYWIRSNTLNERRIDLYA